MKDGTIGTLRLPLRWRHLLQIYYNLIGTVPMKVVKEDRLWSSDKAGMSTKIVLFRTKIVKQNVH